MNIEELIREAREARTDSSLEGTCWRSEEQLRLFPKMLDALEKHEELMRLVGVVVNRIESGYWAGRINDIALDNLVKHYNGIKGES